jgi:uncharacterized protein (TIGR02597 family)
MKETTNMKKLNLSLVILALVAMSVNAESVNSVPVGYVTLKVKANTDQRIGVPMQRASVFAGVSTGVTGSTVTASGITSLSGANFLLVTSGTANGKWEQIQSSSTGSLTLSASISGFAVGNSFEIKPFWTLGTLLPNGGGVPASPDVYDPRALVFLYDPAAVGVNLPTSKAYFYHEGSTDFPAGWYDNDNIDQPQNDIVLSPENGFAIRNYTGSEISVPIVGTVPSQQMAIDIVRTSSGPQDNIVYNKFPMDVTLLSSGLAASGAVAASGDVYDPGDQVFTFPLGATGYNLAAAAAYLYFAGDTDFPAGWYDSSDLDAGLKNGVVIPAGAQIVIRKARGTAGAVAWNPTLPYSLQN